MTKIKLLLADDHKMVREGLKAFFAPTDEFEVVAEASNGIEAVQLAGQTRPDIVLLDLLMPEMDGIEAAQKMRETLPDLKIIIITSSLEESKVIAAIRAGASGYLLKDSSPTEIENAIRKVFGGDTVFPSRITNILVKELSRQDAQPAKAVTLTERETDILMLLANGLSNQEISERLFLSVWTVRTYVTTILDKLGVENRTQAALYAIKEGLVNLQE